MLCLTRDKEERVNFYQTKPNGERRLLGSMLVLRAGRGCARLGFEFAMDVLIVRDELDNLKQQDSDPLTARKE